MEDYKKKYEEALERMKSWARGEHPECFTEAQKTAEFIFPELAESEDERIRKDILVVLENAATKFFKEEGKMPVWYDGAIAWLEKQDGQKSKKVSLWKHWKNGISGNGEGKLIYLVKEGNTYRLTSCLGFECDYIELSELDSLLFEKQGEPKPTDKNEPTDYNSIDPCFGKPIDKVESKFKVGDWITFTRKDGTREVLQVSDIIDGRYYFNHLLHGSWSVKECNEKCHLWTIQDAKPGDVLAAHECVVLFKEIDGLNIKCHCTYHFMNNPSFYVNTLQNKNAFHPATKGQHDLLFQKMKEAGYEWKNNQLEEINNKGFVDLGLPSGTLWATCNLGAEKETDFGMFFQWGDMKGYKGVDEHQFSWSDYKFGKHDSITKYNDLDNKLVLDNEDDPVFVTINGKFKMPTKEQLQELIDHTDQEWTNIDGVNGMKFINKEDDTKYIFIPAAGYCSNGSHYDVGYWGYAWSVSCEESYAGDTWYMGFNAGDVYIDHDNRCLGFSVRGVLNK